MVEAVKAQRRKIIRIVISLLALSVAFIFVFLAKGLLLPVSVAFVLAYIFKPMIHAARLKGIPRSLSVTAIVFGLIAFGLLSFKLIERAIPKGLERAEKQVRIQYKLNQSVINFFGVTEAPSQSSFLYKYLHTEIDTMMSSINGILRHQPTESESLELILKTRSDEHSKKILEMLEVNRAQKTWHANDHLASNFQHKLPQLKVSQLATWLLFPIIFFFLLIDDGGLSRFFIKLIPNSYFELSLTVGERVDKALGRYLRGTALECAAVGAVVAVILLIFGVDITGSVTIGVIAGVLNAIPFLGTLVGLIAGIIYVIMLDHATPLIPFLTKDHLILGVCVAIGVAHLLDNAVFQPLLVGRAVNLHPFVVIVSVAASGMAFGFLGMLLAIPTIVTVKVCLETIYSGLRDYKLM